MSTQDLAKRPSLPPPAEVRARLREELEKLSGEIDQLSDEEVAAADQALSEFEIQRAYKAMCAGADQDFLEGKLDPAGIEQAIKEHRAQHPYR